MNSHKTYIKRCLQLAKKGLGTTYPNPMVGSVIVYDNKIIGEGWHQKAGLAHAEVNAINAVKDKSLLKKSTIYVSLEPCSHYGKTPPCADLIVRMGIPKVVIGLKDPHEKVAGNGIKKLKAAGCEVNVGVFELGRQIDTSVIRKHFRHDGLSFFIHFSLVLDKSAPVVGSSSIPNGVIFLGSGVNIDSGFSS